MKKISLFILLFLSLSCFGQDNKERICFYKEMPHYSSKGVVWQRDTLSYCKIFSEVELYKSSDKDYPYIYKYIDKKREIHYFFIREKDIKINKNKIEIKLYDDSNLELTLFNMYKSGLIFSFTLNQ